VSNTSLVKNFLGIQFKIRDEKIALYCVKDITVDLPLYLSYKI